MLWAIAIEIWLINWFLATFGDPGWGKAAMLRAEGRREERREIPEIHLLQGFQNFCIAALSIAALKPFFVLITKIGQEPIN